MEGHVPDSAKWEGRCLGDGEKDQGHAPEKEKRNDMWKGTKIDVDKIDTGIGDVHVTFPKRVHHRHTPVK